MEHTIYMPIQEIDNRLVFWKTRISEQMADLVSLMLLGNIYWETLYYKLQTLVLLKKTLRDYRFQKIYLTKAEMEKCIRMGDELASIY